MDKLIAEEWVKRLRSGKYTQGTGTLRNAAGQYCCLGVLCEIAAPHLGLTWKRQDQEAWYVIDEEANLLPQSVMDWSGISSGEGDVPPEIDPDFTTLTQLNDDGGYSFVDIADLIERCWDSL